MGIVNWLITGSLKDIPFQSESLDNLAEVMQVSRILKKGKLKRYYKVRFLQAGGLSYIDRIFFDSKYLDTLLPEELLAVGAHEFTHINERHGEKRFLRVFSPSLFIAAVSGFIAFSNFGLIKALPMFANLEETLFTFGTAAITFFLALMAFFYVNAKWNRCQETKCDLSAVKYVNGEAMVSALVKLNQIRSRKITRLDRFLPKLYPTLEQRISDIRTAAENKRKQP